MNVGAHWVLSGEQASKIYSSLTGISVCISKCGEYWGGVFGKDIPPCDLKFHKRSNYYPQWLAVMDAIKNDALGEPVSGVNPYAKEETETSKKKFEGAVWELNGKQARELHSYWSDRLIIGIAGDGQHWRVTSALTYSVKEYFALLDECSSPTHSEHSKPQFEVIRQAILNDDLGKPTIGTNPYTKKKAQVKESEIDGAAWELTSEQATQIDSYWDAGLLVRVSGDATHWGGKSALFGYTLKQFLQCETNSKIYETYPTARWEKVRQAIINDTLGEPTIGVNPFKKETETMKEETKSVVMDSLSRGVKLGAVDSAGSAIMEMMTSIMGVDHPLLTDPDNAEYVKAVGALILTAASSEFELPKGDLINTISRLQLEMSTAKIVSANMEPIMNAVKVIGVKCSDLLPEFKTKE